MTAPPMPIAEKERAEGIASRRFWGIPLKRRIDGGSLCSRSVLKAMAEPSPLALSFPAPY